MIQPLPCEYVLNAIALDKTLMRDLFTLLNPMKPSKHKRHAAQTQSKTSSQNSRASHKYQINPEDITPQGYYDLETSTLRPSLTTRSRSSRSVHFALADDTPVVSHLCDHVPLVLDMSLPTSFKI